MAAVPEIDHRAADPLPQEWVISIREKVVKAQQHAARKPWNKWCIYQVPERLRDVEENKKAYVPHCISIGPHHRGIEQVGDMESHKLVFLYQILERNKQDLTLYLASIKNIEEEARDCYKQKFENLSSNDFVEMMVLDGCFILELLTSYAHKKEIGNCVFSNKIAVNDILLDMVMLENQIPLVVIQTLFKLMYASGNHGEHGEDAVTGLFLNREDAVTIFVLNRFNSEWMTGKPIAEGEEFKELISSIHQKNCLHILDMFRQSLLYRVNDEEPKQDANRAADRHGQVIHGATALNEGGVTFRKQDANCFWDIKFTNGDGVLKIPRIWIHGGTKTILLNVAAFERCHLEMADAKIASYVVFMGCLIRSPEDVSHLHHCGIIQHVLGDDAEVVNMFKSISKEILVDPHDGSYAKLSEEVNAYYKRRRNIWRAILYHKHLNNPFAAISLIAASILLIMTAVQTFYTAFGYYRPNS